MSTTYGEYESVERNWENDASDLRRATAVTEPISAGTLIGAGYHMAGIASSLARASEFQNLVDHHNNLEEPLIFTNDTLVFLAQYMNNLADSVDRNPERFPTYDTDHLGTWLRGCGRQIRAAAEATKKPPKRRIEAR
ncbi:hypothetical protein B5D80_19680 [Micromonospora wenchangensis]|uniref:Uncharacterized protein n=1 Tax=Micromonospora wenchangensis TaxID=1185415 RepID=A0A246RJI2_9ACTN|nr:hypothetical protein [Micromonospora wenchangensis]OWV04715.1 hypothetical protein B5D80_19680 [Micromonospora wenchangensis]